MEIDIEKVGLVQPLGQMLLVLPTLFSSRPEEDDHLQVQSQGLPGCKFWWQWWSVSGWPPLYC